MNNKEFFINCDGVDIHAKLDFPVSEEKKYPLVIIVHGFTGHMEEPHIVAVSKKLNENCYATLRVELYGHGLSGGEFKNHTLLLWVQELIRVIDYARSLDFVTKLYLTGHSQGGAAIVLAAGLKADVLTAIMPLAPGMLLKDAVVAGSFLGNKFDPDHIPEELTVFDEYALSGNYLRVNRFLPFEESIKAFKKPVLIVQSDTDELVPYHYAQELAQAYENATLIKITDDNHVFEKKIDSVTDEIIKFLDKMERQ
jgi:hypothetical protein